MKAPREPRETEGERVDALFADADIYAAGGRRYEAEVLATAAGILAEREGYAPSGHAAVYEAMCPIQRARLDTEAEQEARIALLRALAAEAGERGDTEGAENLAGDADLYEADLDHRRAFGE